MRVVDSSWWVRGLPWMTFGLGGVAIVWMAGAVSVPAAPPGSGLGERHAPALVLARTDRLAAGDAVRERLWLLDPSPLFLPSANNVVGPGPEVIADRPGGEIAKSFPADFSFGPDKPTSDILRPGSLSKSAAAMAARLAGNRWFDGLARRTDPLEEGATAVRVARVEVYRVGEAGPVATMDISSAEGLASAFWRPLELNVLVDIAGAVGQPVVASTSGVDEIDERIRSIVGRELLPTLLLRAGIYRLEIGP